MSDDTAATETTDEVIRTGHPTIDAPVAVFVTVPKGMYPPASAEVSKRAQAALKVIEQHNSNGEPERPNAHARVLMARAATPGVVEELEAMAAAVTAGPKS